MINYIELINAAWELREQGILSLHEHDLYCYLVHKCYKLGWKNPFNQSTKIVCVVLGMNRNALLDRREKLQKLELIKFTEGVARQRPAAYQLCIPCGISVSTEPARLMDVSPAPKYRAKAKTTAFEKPSVEQIRNYCNERQNDVNAQTFFDFYESKDWMIGKNRMRDWQASVRTWENKQKDNKHNFASYDNTKKSYVRF